MRIKNIHISLYVIYWLITALMCFMTFLLFKTVVNSTIPLFYANVRLPDGVSWWSMLFIGIFALLLGSFCLIPLYVFWKFIRNLKKGFTFTMMNVVLLKKLALYLFVFGGCKILYEYLFYQLIADPYGWEISDSARLYFNFFTTIVLFFALFSWALAYVFSIGSGLKRDNDLTV